MKIIHEVLLLIYFEYGNSFQEAKTTVWCGANVIYSIIKDSINDCNYWCFTQFISMRYSIGISGCQDEWTCILCSVKARNVIACDAHNKNCRCAHKTTL